MSLRVVDGGREPEEPDDGRRVLAPGAPASPGPIPNELAQHLAHGEVLAWWNEKQGVQFALLGVSMGAAAVALLFVSGFAPEFWSQPFSGLWPPLLALFSPTLFVLGREWLNRRAVLVTADAVVEVDNDGTVHRLPLGAIVRIRRDWIRGGVTLLGKRGVVRIPPSLMDDARDAVASRLAKTIRSNAGRIEDPNHWLG